MVPFPSAASTLWYYCVRCRFDTVLESGHFAKRPINLHSHHSASAIPVPQSSRKSISILMATDQVLLICLVSRSYYRTGNRSCFSQAALLISKMTYDSKAPELRRPVEEPRLAQLQVPQPAQPQYLFSAISDKSRTRYSNRPLLLHYSMRQGRS